ncbi:MAG: hypothetical protein U0559_10285 [Anaerolineae bacterium]
MRAIERLNTFRGESWFATWVYAIALNVCRGRLRKRRARARLTQILRTLLRVEKARYFWKTRRSIEKSHDAVWNAIHALDDKHREVIVLRGAADPAGRKTSRVLGVTDRTVRARLGAAHTRLREV